MAPDHPRSRGVYPGSPSGMVPPSGSSPLARGLRRLAAVLRRSRWIIPARAGFTPPTPTGSRRPADHPRSRGVYPAASSGGKAGPGSSPLARGLLETGPYPPDAGRIIPARAGFTRRRRRGYRRRPDHPRSRGVYRCASPPGRSSHGSSPLARGLRAARLPAGAPRGIIPARAGFTCDVKPADGDARDHPRSRGVYCSSAGQYSASAGSSPLARGLPDPLARPAGSLRIIPARAGFTFAWLCVTSR